MAEPPHDGRGPEHERKRKHKPPEEVPSQQSQATPRAPRPPLSNLPEPPGSAQQTRARDPLSNLPEPPGSAPQTRAPEQRAVSNAVPEELFVQAAQEVAEQAVETEGYAPDDDWDQDAESMDMGHPTTPGLCSDVDHGDDCLGIRSEAQAFARVIASRQTAAPLSIGLFGDWGSGKSFFMNRMQEEIASRCETLLLARDRLDATELEERWHSRIAQITFNAWHYAEPNLWASLVTRIFDALAEILRPEESVEQTRARLLAEVSEGKQRRDQARMELAIAAEQLASARAQQEERQTALERLREELAVIEAIVPPKGPSLEDPTDAPAVPGTGPDDPPAPTSPPPPDSRPASPPPLKVGGPIAALRVTLRWVWSRGRGTRLVLMIAIGMMILGAILALAWWREWTTLSGEVAMAISAGGVLAAVGSTLSAWFTLIAPKLESAKKAHALLKTGRTTTRSFVSRALGDLLRPDQDAARLARQRVEAARIELDSALVAAEQASAQMARARRVLQHLDGGHRFYDFISQRDESDDYRRHLGLVSLIREDFDRLEQILEQIEHEGAGEDAPPPVSRIVLYIDDLDRCEPERVVEVLQAVHLLLATPIFVVVVAVDVRWLRRSLTLHYDRLLQTATEGADEPDDQARPTPKNYLEKIFQIPFSLRPMEAKGFSALVNNLVWPDLDLDNAVTPAGFEPPRINDPGARVHALEAESPLRLEYEEIEFMRTLHGVIDTPRLAKALVNTYRLLCAEFSEAERESYLRESHYREVMILLAIQVGRSAEAAALFEALKQPRREATLQALVRALAEEREPGDRWNDLHAALVELDPEDRLTHKLRPWVDRIRRFSFNPWPTR